LQRAGATYYYFDGVNALSETIKFTAQYIKYRDDNGNFSANDNYYLLNENDIEPAKQHPYQTNIVTKDINGCAPVFGTIQDAYMCFHCGGRQLKYFTMCDWSTVFKEQYPEVYSGIETSTIFSKQLTFT
jgi:hypothetical protein